MNQNDVLKETVLLSFIFFVLRKGKEKNSFFFFPFHGNILQARKLEWVAMPSSRGTSQLRNQTHASYVSCIGRQVLYQ